MRRSRPQPRPRSQTADDRLVHRALDYWRDLGLPGAAASSLAAHGIYDLTGLNFHSSRSMDLIVGVPTARALGSAGLFYASLVPVMENQTTGLLTALAEGEPGDQVDLHRAAHVTITSPDPDKLVITIVVPRGQIK